MARVRIQTCVEIDEYVEVPIEAIDDLWDEMTESDKRQWFKDYAHDLELYGPQSAVAYDLSDPVVRLGGNRRIEAHGVFSRGGGM